MSVFNRLRVKNSSNISGFTFLPSKKANPELQPKNSGFTLVELLVTISIIAILMGASLTAYNAISQKGRDVKRRSDLQIIKNALTQYYADQGFYPSAGLWDQPNGLRLEDKGVSGSTLAITSQVGNPNYAGPLKTYLQNIPRDPDDKRDPVTDHTTNDDHYCYIAFKDQATYVAHPYDYYTCDNSTNYCKYFVIYSTLEDKSVPFVEDPAQSQDTCSGHKNYKLKVFPNG